MDITEVRIKIMESDQEERLLGFCSITIDHAFVVRDLKIIRGANGFFVAMPSRKLTDRCTGCGGKNQLRAAYCNYCGTQLEDDRSFKQLNGKAKLFSDIAHPINSECRDLIQKKVIQAYEAELILFEQSSYVCRYEDYGENEPPKQNQFEAESNSTEDNQPNVDSKVNLRIDHAQANKQRHKTDSLKHSKRNVIDDFGAGLF